MNLRIGYLDIEVSPMRSAPWRLGLVVCMAMATAVGAQSTSASLPSPPDFDRAPIASEKPMDAAIKAIGPLANIFVDRVINPPFFVGPRDVWVAKFLMPPAVLKPGLCVERMLIVPLRVVSSPNGQTTWQAHNVRWTEQMRVVGDFNARRPPGRNLHSAAICSNLEPFKSTTTYGSLNADSIDQAWQAGLTLQQLAAAARGPAKLPFSLKCRPLGDNSCQAARRTVAGFSVAKLWNVAPCEPASPECLVLNVAAPGDFGDDYWQLRVKLRSPASVDAAEVDMEFVVPPVA